MPKPYLQIVIKVKTIRKTLVTKAKTTTLMIMKSQVEVEKKIKTLNFCSSIKEHYQQKTILPVFNNHIDFILMLMNYKVQNKRYGRKQLVVISVCFARVDCHCLWIDITTEYYKDGWVSLVLCPLPATVMLYRTNLFTEPVWFFFLVAPVDVMFHLSHYTNTRPTWVNWIPCSK